MRAVKYVAGIIDVNVNAFAPTFDTGADALPIEKRVLERLKAADCTERSVVGIEVNGV
jgi:hypothetical protein